MKLGFAAVAFFGLCLSSAEVQAECEPGEEIIKFSHVVAAQGHPKGEMANTLANRINEEMQGKACMQVFAEAQLYDDKAVMEALLLGDVHLAAPSLSKLENYTFQYRVFDLPFAFENMDAVRAFAASEAGQDLRGAMSEYGFSGLGYLFNGLKQFSATRPLFVPQNAVDLTFRIQESDVAMSMIEALGASSRRLPFEAVRDALKHGEVDGQENTWSNIYTAGFFKHQDGVTETNHQVLAYLIVASSDWLNTLDEQTRLQFLSILESVIAQSNSESDAINMANRQRLIDAGTPVRTLTPDQRRAWRTAMEPVWREYEDMIGQSLVDAALASNGRT